MWWSGVSVRVGGETGERRREGGRWEEEGDFLNDSTKPPTSMLLHSFKKLWN